ncbi:MarR family transcriptional regulator [Herbaspirillum rubrisubalbicans]|uniref:HTH cro/C1-type domain-containing protein n=1 Tax=Herbaspirillum rubrisubalbicans Os34 TaxID=1235827 RepID=A0A6M3ZS68_9BURK|nr:MarR family transcriptional regulator [Herbaspirillum rubrisubalbicans]QJQ01495.1 hypothetical protein C798_14985 [Herbaspirillum rubrisubalbicans Os34]
MPEPMPDQTAPMAAFAAQLKQARQTKGWSQRALARACGLHQPQVARAEAGHDVQLSTLVALASALGCTLALAPYPTLPQPAHTALTSCVTDTSAPVVGDRIDANLASYQRAWPSINPLAFALVARILRTAQFVERAVEEVAAKHGINGGELMLLGALRRAGPPFENTPTELRRLFMISLPGITKRLDRLGARGLLERRPAPLDGRVTLIRLLPAGHAVLDDAVGKDMSREFKILHDMPESKSRPLSLLLQELLRGFEKKDMPKGRESA